MICWGSREFIELEKLMGEGTQAAGYCCGQETQTSEVKRRSWDVAQLLKCFPNMDEVE